MLSCISQHVWMYRCNYLLSSITNWFMNTTSYRFIHEDECMRVYIETEWLQSPDTIDLLVHPNHMRVSKVAGGRKCWIKTWPFGAAAHSPPLAPGNGKNEAGGGGKGGMRLEKKVVKRLFPNLLLQEGEEGLILPSSQRATVFYSATACRYM